MSSSLVLTRLYFLRGLSLCFSIAFFSLYTQIDGLYGPKGLLPIHNTLAKTRLSNSYTSNLMQLQPGLLHVLPHLLKLEPDLVMDLLALTAGSSALLIALNALGPTKVWMAFLWLAYFSLYEVGQTFMWFQWDILLLETGVVAIILAPFSNHEGNEKGSNNKKGSNKEGKKEQEEPWLLLSLFMVKWLLFRMMFASGVVKLTGNDESWWTLNALPTHFESQCIPTPLAWHLYKLPTFVQRLSVVSTYVIEIAMAFLFFAPTRFLRLLSFCLQCFLMLNIMLAGNYNFFNIHYIVLCLSLLNDDIIQGVRKKRTTLIEHLFNVLIVALIVYYTFKYCFRVHLDASDFILHPELQFTLEEFMEFVRMASKIVVYVAFVYMLAFIVEIMRKVNIAQPRRFLLALLHIFSCLLLFALSLPVFLRGIGNPWLPSTPFNDHLRNLQAQTAHLNLVNSYGLFRSMTGVGGRPEVVLEGSSDGDTWHELPFLYKPGNLTTAPPIVLPHQPRLDWQMWFAALGHYQHNPWLISLIYRLLEGEPSVLGLMDRTHYPFPSSSSPPKLIRAKLYLYHFTSEMKDRAWWWREEQSEYLPPLSLNMQELKAFMINSGILDKSNERKEYSREGSLASFLLYLRQLSIQGPQNFLVMSILLLFCLNYVRKFLS